MKTGINLSLEEIGALEALMQKASVTLQQGVNNGYRPEFSQDLKLYDTIRKKLEGNSKQIINALRDRSFNARKDN